MKYKCYACGEIVDHINYVRDRWKQEGDDALQCPNCHAIEPGFEEVQDE